MNSEFESQAAVQAPALYAVQISFDGETPLEFYKFVFEYTFGRSKEESDKLIPNLQAGSVVIGWFTHEVAETKLQRLLMCAEKHGYRLQCQLRKGAAQ